jgi:hypothetical protein
MVLQMITRVTMRLAGRDGERAALIRENNELEATIDGEGYFSFVF